MERRCRLTSRRFLALCLLALSAAAFAAPSVRIKDIAAVRGIRGNQILGLGLVTGLNGKGDSSASPLLRSSLSSLVSSFGVSIAPQDIRSKNAAVGESVSVFIADSQKTFTGRVTDGKAVQVDLP
jgi:flagellar P-ring protein precursor FlgI